MFKYHLQPQTGAAQPLLFVAMSLIAFCWPGWRDSYAGQQSEAQTHTVLIKDFKYAPEVLTVKAGDTVIWKNEDIVPHTATANGKSFDSKNIGSKASWKYVANKPGNFPYICAYHPTMKAKLIVK